MQPVSYERALTPAAALELGAGPESAWYAGGTSLIDLMKLDVVAPGALIDINHLPLGEIAVHERYLRLGALVRMSDAADSLELREAAPAVAAALAASASAQLRNMASLGGNLMQRTRCSYFRDAATACNKRRPGSGCAARTGINADHAVLGTSDDCIAVHPSDFAVALMALDVVIAIDGPDGARTVPIGKFYHQPGSTPHIETALGPGELIVAIDIARTATAAASTYVKVRERTSYAFALASCAVGLEQAPDGTIVDARIALGGVATVPWRAREAERVLLGRRPDRELFAAAARAAFTAARPTPQNAAKIGLGMSTIVRALETVAR